MPRILDEIKKANDIKKVSPMEYKKLAKEIRRFLVDRVSKTGGHLSSNLGVVELTMALHLFLDFPKDKLVWDVGHQSYIHKILTGRKKEFLSLRKYQGLSGFPKRKESDADAIHAGHSSTSISAALGMAKARDLKGEKTKVVAVIGDGALSGGMAYEALNNAAKLKTGMIVILNDNNMSISENVGGMANYLGKIRSNSKYQNMKADIERSVKSVPIVGNKLVEKIRRSKDSIKRLVIPGMLFEDMGITYIGPIDGHNIEHIIEALETANSRKETVLVHVVTKKGKGYSLAEKYPSTFHGVNPFNIKTGKTKNKKEEETYTDVFSNKLIDLAKTEERIVAITAAMPSGTGLIPFQKLYPKRFCDVGIAEEHAVTFAAGLASNGMIPVVAIYSTFLQRAYDQILHDVCIGNYHVVFAIDRAGLVGSDGETHQGIFDLSFLTNIPNMTILAPKNSNELEMMLEYSITFNGPIAVRYPRGTASQCYNQHKQAIELGKSEVLETGKKVALLAVGEMVEKTQKIKEKLEIYDVIPTIVNVRFIKPIDERLLDELELEHSVLVTLEDNVENGGFGQMVSSYLCQKGSHCQHINISIKDAFVEHGDIESLQEKIGLDTSFVVEKIVEKLFG